MSYIVPFVDPGKHYRNLKEEIDAAITDCLSRGDLIMRRQLRDYEEHFAAFVGTKYAVGVSSGYHALHFSLIAAGLGPGDEVITVAHTFVATISAIVHVGATPVLIDVGKDYNMDMDALERAVTPRTKAVLPVHLNGRMCDMDRLMAVAQKYNLIVIEDAAQALGARYDGKAAGSFGLAGCFSHYPFKILGAFGDGGIITTDDPKVARIASLLRYNGEDRETGEYHYHGYTALLDNVWAAVLDVKLKYLPQWIERRREIAMLYYQGLSDIPELTLPHFEGDKYFDVYQNYVIRTKRRDELAAYLKERGVETLIHWPKPVWEHKGLKLGEYHLPETESICREVLSLPMNVELTNEQVDYVVNCVRDFFRRGMSQAARKTPKAVHLGNTLASPRIAARTAPFQESVIREMTRLGDETGAINLSQGLPDFDPPSEVLEAAIAAIQSGDNQYTFPFGTLAFRQAIAAKSARYNRILADPETEVTVTCGVSEAIMATILALTDPGDEVIILEPWYENYVPACQMAGVRPRFVPLREPEYTFDPDELRAAFNNRTRLIIINTPHNPTGRVFTRAELSIIAGLCQEFGVIAVTDEIYEHILYDGREHISIGSLDGMYDRTVTISGLGKSYSVTGWRVGWAIAAPSLTSMIRKTHDYLTVCAPAPFQAAGIIALGLPESYYTEMRVQYEARRTILLEALDVVGMPYCKPEGAYYVMADFGNLQWHQAAFSRPGWTPDRAFAEYMAREVGVAVVPGSSFYAGGNQGTSRVRFNFAKQENTLKEAARRLQRLKCL